MVGGWLMVLETSELEQSASTAGSVVVDAPKASPGGDPPPVRDRWDICPIAQRESSKNSALARPSGISMPYEAANFQACHESPKNGTHPPFTNPGTTPSEAHRRPLREVSKAKSL